ncbi:MAG: VIT1/CCC1 transporter family protein [Ilumatobacteraceae bacterium]
MADHHDQPGGYSFMVHRHRDVSGGSARAAVFGISDGLVSNVALILGVAAADASRSSVLVAGVAGLLAGATSMAAGEYVSMKAQSELVERELEIERRSLADQPEMEQRELATIYRRRGISAVHADAMAKAVMSDPDIALEVHAREELGIGPEGLGNPARAALASFIAFAIGALIPLIPWFFGEGDAAIVASAVLGLVAAALVGVVIARFTERSVVRTVVRQVGWAVVACAATWLIGSWLGAAIA